MRRLLRNATLLCGALVSVGLAQAPTSKFPPDVFTAKTVAIVNDTKTPAVEKGADDALASWGQFKVVQDPQLADVTLRFEKSRQHEGHDSQTPDPNGKDTNYGYTMSFSSTIEMKAFLKDAETPFYSTKTDNAKAKAGSACVNSFHTAFRTAYTQSKP